MSGGPRPSHCATHSPLSLLNTNTVGYPKLHDIATHLGSQLQSTSCLSFWSLADTELSFCGNHVAELGLAIQFCMVPFEKHGTVMFQAWLPSMEMSNDCRSTFLAHDQGPFVTESSTPSPMDCKQSLFCSKIFGEEQTETATLCAVLLAVCSSLLCLFTVFAPYFRVESLLNVQC